MQAHSGIRKTLSPSHLWKSLHHGHQVRSKQKLKYRWMRWSSRLKVRSKLIMWWMMGAILYAWWKWPIADFNSHHSQDSLLDQNSSSVIMCSLLSTGSHAWIPTEYRMDRQGHVEWPSSLSGRRGRPSFEHSWIHGLKLLWQAREDGEPRERKPSN